MPVQTPHPDYKRAAPQWERCNDAFEGQDTVKRKCLEEERYLRKLSGMDGTSDEEKRSWQRYLDRALWFNATKRTMRAFTGFVFRRDPIVQLPTEMEALAQDITGGGVSLQGFVRRTVARQIRVGRYGILISRTDDGNGGRWAGYDARNILWAEEKIVNGVRKLSHLRLRELTAPMPNPDDPWLTVQREQIRVLFLDAEGRLEVQVHRQDPEDPSKFVEVAEERKQPSRNEERLDFIPFVFVNVTHNDAQIEEPPLLDLVDVNIDHFRLDAVYKYGLEKCGVPQYYAAGFKFGETNDLEVEGHGEELNAKVALSAEYAWVSDNPNAKAGLIEFTGQGLRPLKEEREQDEARMAVLGARILEAPKAGVEAAATMEVRHSGEKSMLAEMARTAEEGITQALGILAWWQGLTETQEAPEDEISYKLNKDYVSARMGHQMLREWTSALLSGSISYETYYYGLEQGEMTRPGVTAEQEQDSIDEQAPISPALDEPASQSLPSRATRRSAA